MLCCGMAVLVNCMQPLFSVIYRNDMDSLFYSLLATSMVASSFESGSFTFVDSGVLQRIRGSPTPVHYGIQRMFGAAGNALGEVSDSLAVTIFPPSSSISPYTGIFVTYTIYGVILLFTFHLLFKESDGGNNTEQSDVENEISSSDKIKTLILQFLKKFGNIIFLFGIILNGTVQALAVTFGYVYLKELNAPAMIFGLGFSIGVIGCCATYILSPRIQKYFGPEYTTCFAWIALAIRFFCLAYLCRLSPYLFIVVELFQGPSYSLFWLSCIEYIERNSDPAIITTMCGIINGLFNPCSFMLANLLGAKLYELYGGMKLFSATAIFCLLWSVLYGGYIFLREKRRRRRVSTPL